MVRPASNARSIPCWQSPRFARESGRSLFPTEHRRFKRGAVSIGAPFRRVETSHNGCSENFLGDGRIFWGDGNLDGVPVDAKGRALYSERFIHAEVYRVRADVNAVVHAHASSVIPFADTNVPMRPMNHMGSFMGDGVPVFDIRKNFGITDMLVSDSKKGHALAEVLGNKNVVLMRGHGVAVVGPTVRHVVGRSIYLEVNARTQAQALSFGSPITYLDPQEAKKMLDSGENGGYERPWAAWKAKAMGK